MPAPKPFRPTHIPDQLELGWLAGFFEGEVYKLKAKVKRHDSDPKWGKSTVVTYLEEV